VIVGAATVLGALILPALPRLRPVVHAVPARVPDLAGPVRPADLAVVVPYYNPGPIVIDTLSRVSQALAAMTSHFEVIAVSDGSTDGSDALVAAARIQGLVPVVLPVNRGKGGALRAGFALAHADAVGFIDADGDIPPEQLHQLVAAMQRFEADVVAGSKNHPDSTVRMSALRRTWSWGYQRLVRLLFRLDLRDTQTGIKLYRREVLERVLPMLREDGFAIDLEIFVAARSCGFRQFVETPVLLDRRSGSTVSVRTVLRMLSSTLAIYWHARIALGYARVIPPAATADVAVPSPMEPR
jgi:glycosyltransferase involved in cell wall biosynthesis